MGLPMQKTEHCTAQQLLFDHHSVSAQGGQQQMGVQKQRVACEGA